ncbi:MAG: PspC domain-containing protein [Candidatus Izemoplasmatales bacterium]|nr:PspC domain-containing protein [Candidatus Izemoplasmatales bacterium]
MTEKRRLYRDTENQKLFGVCSGLSDYFDVDVTLIRVLWLVAVFAGGTGVLLYLILAIVVEPKSVVMAKAKKEEKTIDDSDDPFAKYDK